MPAEQEDTRFADIPFRTKIKLLRKQLEDSLEECSKMESNESKKLALRDNVHTIEAFLKNARFYLREIQKHAYA